MTYAVVACAACREPWAVELRHATATCPACAQPADLARRTRLWQGDSPQEAQAVAAARRAEARGGSAAILALADRRPVPRHDSPVDAAAAQAAGIANRSARAEAVALVLTRLLGAVPHAALVEALGKAGLDAERADAEVVRMLACDVMLEPRAGFYQAL